MYREFLIEEIMLSGVSGEVRGRVFLDRYSGRIEQVLCEAFSFRTDDSDVAIELSENQRVVAIGLVERVLESDSDLCLGSSTYVASASHLTASMESSRVLGSYLEKPRRPVEQSLRKRVV